MLEIGPSGEGFIELQEGTRRNRALLVSTSRQTLLLHKLNYPAGLRDTRQRVNPADQRKESIMCI